MRCPLTVLSASSEYQDNPLKERQARNYLGETAKKIRLTGIPITYTVRKESPAEATYDLVIKNDIDLVLLTTRGRSNEKNWSRGGLSSKLIHLMDIPVMLVQVFESGPAEAPHFGRILVALDGSVFAEQLLPYAALAGTPICLRIDARVCPGGP